MIRHIVLFKFKTDLPKESKKEKIAQIKSGLEKLTGLVPTLKRMEVGINCNPNEKYDLSLTSEFESMAGLEAYATNPDHLKVARVIGSILEERACVDYEF